MDTTCASRTSDMNNLSMITTALAIVGAIWMAAVTWQNHLDQDRRVHDALCDQVTVLQGVVFAEHPTYTTWFNLKEKC